MQHAAAGAAHSHLNDREVARRIEADDLDILRTLMRTHNQRLNRTARSILGDDAEAEDAVQEAYVLAYQGISGYRGDARICTARYLPHTRRRTPGTPVGERQQA